MIEGKRDSAGLLSVGEILLDKIFVVFATLWAGNE